jgi:lysophospholipase L1-like esterase
VLSILREVLQYEPDLMVVYTGHNEFLERRSYEGFDRDSLRARTSSWLANLRLVQVGKKLLGRDGYRPEPAVKEPTVLAEEVDALLDYQGGLADYHRDPELAEAVAVHFRWNLNQMVTACRQAGVPLLLIKPVSNVLDCPPLKFETAPGLADPEREEFEQLWAAARTANSAGRALEFGLAALKIDPQHAGANFLVGRLLVETGSLEAAGPYLIAARDYDVCPLRAPSYLLSIVEEIGNQPEVTLVDAEELFAADSPAGLVGDNWLVDHIHPSIEGHQRLGSELARACQTAGLVTFLRADWREAAQQAFQRRLSELSEDYFQRGQQRLQGLLLWTQGRAKKVRPDAEAGQE